MWSADCRRGVCQLVDWLTFPSALLCSGWHQAQERTQGAQPNTCIFQKCSCNCVKSTIYLASGVTQLALVGAYLYRDAL